MKKKGLLLFLSAMLLFTACQTTPEADVVVQKNTEQMIEAAKEAPESTAGETLQERYGIPQRLSFTASGAGGKLEVSVDAAVEAPEIPLPIVRVEAAQFSQEVVTGFWNAFLGDMPMLESVRQQTKADIEQSILYYKQVQAGLIDSVVMPEEAQACIDELEAQYASAPDSIEPVPADGLLKRITEDLSAWGGHGVVHSEGLNATSADHMYNFSVSNDRDNTEPISWDDYDAQGNVRGGTTVPVSRNAHLSCYHHVSDAQYVSTGNSGVVFLRLGRGDALPEAAAARLKLTPEEAALSVEAFLKAAGISETMGISGIYLINDKDPHNGRPEAAAYAYNIVCTRLVGGLPCVYLEDVSGSGVAGGGEAPSWGYEVITFQLGDEGVWSIVWRAPMKVTETVSEAASLKPFSQIAEIARKMLLIKYEPDAKEEYTASAKLTVERVTLSLQRVAEQDHFDRGLLVPVWNFFGVYAAERTSGYTQIESRSLLSVNAIDGSIIDPELGY